MLSREARGLMATKNDDYAGEGDLFRNFAAVGAFGIDPLQGFLTRIIDKVSRLATFVQSGTEALKHESYRDSILDILNYCVLLHAYLCHLNDERMREVDVEVVE